MSCVVRRRLTETKTIKGRAEREERRSRREGNLFNLFKVWADLTIECGSNVIVRHDTRFLALLDVVDCKPNLFFFFCECECEEEKEDEGER